MVRRRYDEYMGRGGGFAPIFPHLFHSSMRGELPGGPWASCWVVPIVQVGYSLRCPGMISLGC